MSKRLPIDLSSGERGAPPYKLFLPFWGRAIFVDWFGVLSRDPFWHTIIANTRHPYHGAVSRAHGQLFRERLEIVRAWMRGEIKAGDVLDDLDVHLDRRSKPGFLMRRLISDGSKVGVRMDLLHGIRHLARDCYVVVATDNMDVFAAQSARMGEFERTIDDVLLSSRLGALKTERLEDFFGPWLRDHRLNFENALLIDDNIRTCQAFEMCGGRAVAFSNVSDALARVKSWLVATKPSS